MNLASLRSLGFYVTDSWKGAGMIKKLLWWLLGGLLLVACSEANQKRTKIDHVADKQARLTHFFTHNALMNNFMGGVAFLHQGEVIYRGSFGYDNIEQLKISNENSQYRIGSLSKTYTATLVLNAVEENKLALTKTIDTFLPDLVNAGDIQIIDLLRHQSGIPNYTDRDTGFFDYRTMAQSKSQMLENIIALGSDFSPKSETQYSNSNYYLLALILEKVYSTSYGELLAKYIAKPLALQHTYHANREGASDVTTAKYSYTFEQGKWQQFLPTHLSTAMGAGSIVSTPIEVGYFFHALFNDQLISQSSLEKMIAIENGFGLGVQSVSFFDHQGFGHSGNIDAYFANGIYLPKEKLSVVILSNGSNDNFHQIFQGALKSYFNYTSLDLPVPADELKNYLGVYQQSPEDNFSTQFIELDGKLAQRFSDGFTQKLLYQGERKFIFEQVNADPVIFTFSANGDSVVTRLGNEVIDSPKYKVR